MATGETHSRAKEPMNRAKNPLRRRAAPTSSIDCSEAPARRLHRREQQRQVVARRRRRKLLDLDRSRGRRHPPSRLRHRQVVLERNRPDRGRPADGASRYTGSRRPSGSACCGRTACGSRRRAWTTSSRPRRGDLRRRSSQARAAARRQRRGPDPAHQQGGIPAVVHGAGVPRRLSGVRLSPENSCRVFRFRTDTRAPVWSTASAVLTTTCATTEALA